MERSTEEEEKITTTLSQTCITPNYRVIDPKVTEKVKIEIFGKNKQKHTTIFTNMHRKACDFLILENVIGRILTFATKS